MKKLRFNTRDKKPYPYYLLILTGIVILALIGFLIAGLNAYGMYAHTMMIVFYTIIVVSFLINFVKQVQFNPYSYNTIYYMGFALFFLMILGIHISIVASRLANPEMYPDDYFTFVLLSGAENFMLLTSPFLFIFSCALCVSNISLIRHEGKRLVNVLGIILSFLIVGGIVFTFWFNYYVMGSEFEVMMHDLVSHILSVIYLYFECMLIGVIVAGVMVSKYEPDYNQDFIIILGCGIRKDGTPTPLLRGRIGRGLQSAKKQKELTGKDVIFVTSGGQGPKEVISESACMKQYLLEQGVPEERIIEEDQSTNTFENMKFSKEKIWAVNPNGNVAFSTTNYHVFRSGLYARRVKMRAVGMGAKTKWYFWPNAAVREFVGLITEHRGKQIIIIGSMIVICIIMTILNYSNVLTIG